MVKGFMHSAERYSFFPRYSPWILFLVFLVFSFIYRFHDILFLSPQSIHQWRQCDCLSIALNYFQDNNGFFQPAIHNLRGDGSGRAVGEFPLVYYLVGQVWKITGHHEFIFRLINVFIFFFSLVAIFRLYENVLKDSLVAVVFALLLFTSPVLVFYANNFLTNITAFSLALLGLVFFSRFYMTGKAHYLYGMCFLYALAGLLKISSLLSFIPIVAIFFIELFHGKWLGNRKLFTSPRWQIFPLAAVFLVQAAWYFFAKSYNEKYNSNYFFLHMSPIWDLDTLQIKDILQVIQEHIRWSYFRIETQIILVAMFIFGAIHYSKANKVLYFLSISIAAGCVFFVLLFFPQLKDHDYYVIDLFILVPVTILCFLVVFKNKFPHFYHSYFFKILLIAFLIHNADFARRRMHGRYNGDSWQNENYTKHVKVFEEIRPYLTSLGIKKEDKVISLSDNSPNISLYLMNQKGWTNYGMDQDSTQIRKRIDQGAKYLLIYDKSIYKNRNITYFIRNKIGNFKTVDIYKL